MPDAEISDEDSAEQEIVNAVTFISKILLTGVILAVLIIGARLFGHGGGVALAGSNVNVPANYAWILFVVLTLGHVVYARNYLIRIIIKFWESHDCIKDRRKVFDKIRSSPNMFVFGLIPRVQRRAGGRLVIMGDSRGPHQPLICPFCSSDFLDINASLVCYGPWSSKMVRRIGAVVSYCGWRSPGICKLDIWRLLGHCTL